MKTNQTNPKRERPNNETPCAPGWLASCRKILAQIAGVREALLAEASRAFSPPERLLRLALNEAEAAAWQTSYPHLVFPVLATEKIQAVAAWNTHQQSVRRTSPVFALAA